MADVPHPVANILIGDDWEDVVTLGQMHAHAHAVSAAKDAEIAGLRAEVAQLRERPEPDCRTCKYMGLWYMRCNLVSPRCINGNRYDPLSPVRLWRTT